MHPHYYLAKAAPVDVNALSERLYFSVCDAPIYDYHCHLSPKEIYEDKVFASLGEVWLAGDHYKWRLMRCAGIPENKITGDADYHDKFLAYVEALEYAVGNPLKVWSEEELRLCFGMDNLPLNRANAETIWEKANAVIEKKKLSPRKMMHKFHVRFVATTDDPSDDLYYHKKLAEDSSMDICVVPSFRPDKAMQFTAPGYLDYIHKLGVVAEKDIDSLDTLLAALEARMAYFKELGCIYTDVGIAAFPTRIAGKEEAGATYLALLQGQTPSAESLDGLLGYLFVALGRLYRYYGFVMQWHLGAVRNPNTLLYEKLGPDCGCDCVGLPVDTNAVLRILDAIDAAGGLPKTILYSLNQTSVNALCSVAGSFRNVQVGAAWWFNDHRQGILDTLGSIASVGHLGSFRGMLTDSRSFLSYVRHDYFRRLLAEFLANLYATGECRDEDLLLAMMRRISYENIQK